MNGISLDDIIDLSKGTSIKDATEWLDAFIAKVKLLGLVSEQNFESSIKMMEQIKVSAMAMRKEIEKGNASLENYNKSIELLYKSASKLADNAKQAKTTSKAYEDLNKTAKDLKTSYENLGNANEGASKKAKASIDVQTGSLSDLKKQLNEAEKALKGLADTDAGYTKKTNEVNELRLVYNKLNNAYKEQEKAAKQTADSNESETNSYKAVSAQLNRLRGEYKDLEIRKQLGEQLTEKEIKRYKELGIAVDNLDKALKDTDAKAGQFQRNVGNYGKAIEGFKSGIGLGDIAQGFTVAGAAAKVGEFAVEQLINYGQKLNETYDEVKQQITDVSGLVQLQGTDLEKYVGSARAISKTFGVDFQETVDASNTLINEFGATQEEVFKNLALQLASGAKDLNISKEYATQLKQAGVSLDEFTKLNILSSQKGLFSDKSFDAIKEIQLRLGDLTPAQDKVLASLGKTGDAIKKTFASGDKIGAVEMLVKEINNLEKAGVNVQPIISNLGGGALEDLGKKGREVLGTFREFNIVLNEEQQRALKKFETQQKIQSQSVELVSKIRNLTAGASSFADQAELAFLTATNSIFDYFARLYDKIETFFEVSGLGDLFSSIFDGLKSAFDTVSNYINSITTGDGFLGGIVSYITDIIGFLINPFETLLDFWIGFSTEARSIFAAITTIIERFQFYFTETVDAIDSGVNDIVSFFEYLQTNLSNAINYISEIIGNIAKPFVDVFDSISSYITGFFNDFYDYLSKLIPSISDLFPETSAKLKLLILEGKRAYEDSKAGIQGSISAKEKAREEEKKLGVETEKTTQSVNTQTKSVGNNTDAMKKQADAAQKSAEAQEKFREETDKLSISIQKSAIDFAKFYGDQITAVSLQRKLDLQELEKDYKETTKKLNELAKEGKIGDVELQASLKLNETDFQKNVEKINREANKELDALKLKPLEFKELDTDFDKNRLKRRQDIVFADLTNPRLKQEKKDLEELKKTYENVYGAIDKLVTQSFENKQAGLDRQLETQNTLLQAEIGLAETTNQNVDIAAREGKLNEIEKQKIETEKEKLRFEKGKIFLDIFKSYLEKESPAKALALTAKDFALTESILAGFYDGGFAEGDRVLDLRSGGSTGSNNGIFAKIHSGEHITPAWEVNDPNSRSFVNVLENYRKTKVMDYSLLEIPTAKETVLMPSIDMNLLGSVIAKNVSENVKTTYITADSMGSLIESVVRGRNEIEKRRFVNKKFWQ
jgi:hypothetical protein